MENPPDLLVAFTSDEQCHDKKKLLSESDCQDRDAVISGLQRELQQLRAELAERHSHSEFEEQSRLLQQRFHEEVYSVIEHHDQLIQQVTNDLSAYVTQILRNSIENIESLRLLHQKELSSQSASLTTCLNQQSFEMAELCSHLIEQQRTKPLVLFQTLTNDCRNALNQLQTSFDSKINYLSGIHSSTIDKSNVKHAIEIEEMKCELNLACHR